MYTDSQAAMAISNNLQAMGNVRHLSIRTHVTRCYISLGDICLKFCLTEQMVADLFTKIVTAAQEGGLLDRFYNDVTHHLVELSTLALGSFDFSPVGEFSMMRTSA